MEDFYPIRLLRTHAYALVDREALGGDMPADWPVIPLVPPGLENDLQRLPALLPLHALTEEQSSDLLKILAAPQENDPLPVVTLLDSDCPPEQMRMHWVQQLVVHLPGNQRALLRSYDPRAFAQLQWMFSPAQLAALFGPVRRWTICLDGHWQTLQRPVYDGPLAGPISVDQAALLGRIGLINQVRFNLPDTQRQPHETVSRAIDALLVRARRQGLREDDQCAFALRGMTVHPHFDLHPQILALLQEMPDAEHTLDQAFAHINEVQWQRIAEDVCRRQDTAMNGKQA